MGAGAAGISMALDWMDSGKKVILLEGGGFEYDDKVQDLYSGTTTGQRYFPLRACRLHYFGGTTGHWAGMCAPFEDLDFKKRDWVPHSGWPITKQDLDPFYAKAQIPLELGPYEYGADYWLNDNPELSALPLDDKVVWNKIWQFSTSRFNDRYKETMVNAENIHLYTYANLVDIKANEAVSEISEVTIANYEGKTHTVRARQFVLACGAIQNARMLLACNKQAPNGLGNDNDVVGRYFLEHLEIKSAELWLTKPLSTDFYQWQFGVTKARAELAIAESLQQELQILNGTADLMPMSVGKNMKPRIDVWQSEDPRKSLDNTLQMFQSAAQKGSEEKGENLDRAFMMNTRIEQAPNPDCRVTLDTEKDSLGIPKTKLHWELSELDQRSIRKMYEIIGVEMGKAGIARLKLMDYLADGDDSIWPEFTQAGWHHMGTTRMSDDPKTGVVDANCTVHGIHNLHIAGSSCYATAGAPNPTLTLVALSLRLSDHLKGKV